MTRILTRALVLFLRQLGLDGLGHVLRVRRDLRFETVDDLAGLSRSHPGVALLMALFLFSLSGIPLTAGFIGKFLLFFGTMAVSSEAASPDQTTLYRLLAFIGVLNAAIGAWYYLRITAAMYLRTSVRPLQKSRNLPGLATVWICAALTLAFGVYPWPLVRSAQAAMPRVVESGAERAER